MSDAARFGEHVPHEVRQKVGVEDDGGEHREEDVEHEEDTHGEPTEDDVAQESTQRTDVTRVEYLVLVGEDDTWVAETPPHGGPLTGVQSGDEKVVEVDTDAEDDGVDDEKPPRVHRDSRECDSSADDNRDEEVLMRVDSRSPTESTPVTVIKPTASPQSRSFVDRERDERDARDERERDVRDIRDERDERAVRVDSDDCRTGSRSVSSSRQLATGPSSAEKRRTSRGMDNTKWNKTTRSGFDETR